MDIDTQKIMREIRANHDRLDNCPRHRFDQTEYEKMPRLGMKLTCVHCSGTMDVVAISHYIKGYEAHGGDCNDIWPGFRASKESVPTDTAKPE